MLRAHTMFSNKSQITRQQKIEEAECLSGEFENDSDLLDACSSNFKAISIIESVNDEHELASPLSSPTSGQNTKDNDNNINTQQQANEQEESRRVKVVNGVVFSYSESLNSNSEHSCSPNIHVESTSSSVSSSPSPGKKPTMPVLIACNERRLSPGSSLVFFNEANNSNIAAASSSSVSAIDVNQQQQQQQQQSPTSNKSSVIVNAKAKKSGGGNLKDKLTRAIRKSNSHREASTDSIPAAEAVAVAFINTTSKQAKKHRFANLLNLSLSGHSDSFFTRSCPNEDLASSNGSFTSSTLNPATASSATSDETHNKSSLGSADIRSGARSPSTFSEHDTTHLTNSYNSSSSSAARASSASQSKASTQHKSNGFLSLASKVANFKKSASTTRSPPSFSFEHTNSHSPTLNRIGSYEIDFDRLAAELSMPSTNKPLTSFKKSEPIIGLDSVCSGDSMVLNNNNNNTNNNTNTGSGKNSNNNLLSPSFRPKSSSSSSSSPQPHKKPIMQRSLTEKH